jgi:hypothetical protein
MMHIPLHAAACYLDPKLFWFTRNYDRKVKMGLKEAIERLNQEPVTTKKVREQLRAYRLGEEIFLSASAKEDRTSAAPYTWWEFYGAEAPELQHFAICILTQG